MSADMITSAFITHYKSIYEAHLQFRGNNIIVGPNGSGKSNILDAICFLHDCLVEDIDTAITKRHGIDSLRQWSRTRPYNINIELRFENNNGSGSYKVVIASQKGSYRILEEQGLWTGPNPVRRPQQAREVRHSSFTRDANGEVRASSGFADLHSPKSTSIGTEELFLTFLNNRGLIGSHIAFMPIANELRSFSKYNIYPNTLRSPQIVSRDTTLVESGSNLASVLKLINSNKRLAPHKDDIISSIKVIMPSVIDFQVRSAGGFYVPVLRVRESNGDVHDFNLSQISDGTLRTLGLLTAFYQPNAPSKIGIEEPEQMIHPGALSVIHEAMSAFTTRPNVRGQVFVTTHSPTLLDLFDPEDIIWAQLRNGITECGHVRSRQLDLIRKQLFSAGELLLAEGIH